MSINVIQIAGDLENEASGTTYCIRNLSAELANQNIPVEIMTLGSYEPTPIDGVKFRVYEPAIQNIPLLRNLQISSLLKAELATLAARPDTIMHCNGLWRMVTVYPGKIAKMTKAPLLISPHGMLSESALSFSRTQKQLFSRLAQREAIGAATCFHATSEQEYRDIRNFGITAPVAIVPNGINLPKIPNTQPMSNQRTLLYLGRIHPIKGLESLVQAWRNLEADFPDWELKIVGPSERGHSETLQELARSLKIKRIEFSGGLFGAEKDKAFQSADIFVLPTTYENFGMVVVESLSHQTPVVCSKGAPWAELERQECGWWVEQGAEPLSKALSAAMEMPKSDLAVMGRKGRTWVEQSFSWTRVTHELLDVYRWCLGQADRPDCVVSN